MHPNFGAIIHMREVSLLDSLDMTLGGCKWKGRAANWRTILHFLEVILSNIQIIVWRAEALDSLGMH